MTARARKKTFYTPPMACQIAGCPAEYEAIGTYRDTHHAAELGGWLYRIIGHNGRRYVGDWLCPAHKHQLPWWPGRPLLALPQREPGATTRAEFVGVVPRDVSWSTAALPAAEPDLEPLPPQDDPLAEYQAASNELHYAEQDPPPLPQRTPAGPPAHPWQAAMEAELSEQALAGGEPLESLAPAQEDEDGA